MGLFVTLIVTGSLGCGPEESADSGRGPMGGATPVIAVPVVRQDVSESLSLVGTVEANEMVEIKAETIGIVERIRFEEGQDVEEGDVLIELDRRKLESAYEESRANLELSESELKRSEQLFGEQLISRQEFDQALTRADADRAVLQLRKRQLSDARVISPFSGVVGARVVSPGQVINREQTLTWLVDLDPVKVSFNVPERFFRVIRKGQGIALSVAAFPERIFRGTVYFVAPFVDPKTRNVEMKAVVPNEDRTLIPGMFANLELTLTIRENAMVIPESAVFRILENDRAVVYVVGEESTAATKTISIGERMAGSIEVLSGLVDGDQVIVEGTQKIGPGAPIVMSGGTTGPGGK